HKRAQKNAFRRRAPAIYSGDQTRPLDLQRHEQGKPEPARRQRYSDTVPTTPPNPAQQKAPHRRGLLGFFGDSSRVRDACISRSDGYPDHGQSTDQDAPSLLSKNTQRLWLGKVCDGAKSNSRYDTRA